MPLPLSWRGVVTVPIHGENEPGRTLDRLAAGLWRRAATDVRRDGDAVTFRAGLLRPVLKTNPLIAIRRGRLAATRTPAGVAVEFRLDFAELAVAGVVPAVIAGAFVSAAGASGWFWLPPLVWCLSVGPGVWSTVRRFPALVRRMGLGLDE